MDLSVIIVNFNTKKLTLQCLTSVFKYTKELDFEVIVVDNNSKDGSVEAIENNFPQIKLIKNKTNYGFAKANNQGISKARGKYILLLNSDTYLFDNSLKKLVKVANKIKKFGMIAPLILNQDKTIQQSVGFFPNLPQIFLWMSFIDDLPFGKYLKPYHMDHDSFYKSRQEIDWITGAAIFIAKDTINKEGKLDEGIFMYGEDVEWCYRIKQSGKKNYLIPDSKLVHIGRGSSKTDSTNAILGEYRGIIYFYKKHKSKIALQIAIFLLKMGALARIIIFGALGKKVLVSSYEKALKIA